MTSQHPDKNKDCPSNGDSNNRRYRRRFDRVNQLFQWLIPLLLAFLVIVFSLWASTMKSSAVGEALVQMKEVSSTRYFPLSSGDVLKARLDALEKQLDEMVKTQKEMLRILIQLSKEEKP